MRIKYVWEDGIHSRIRHPKIGRHNSVESKKFIFEVFFLKSYKTLQGSRVAAAKPYSSEGLGAASPLPQPPKRSFALRSCARVVCCAILLPWLASPLRSLPLLQLPKRSFALRSCNYSVKLRYLRLRQNFGLPPTIHDKK